MTTPRALIVLTSHGQLGDTGQPTGFYVPEAAHPWHVFRQAGWDVDFVSPAGGRPPGYGEDRDDPVQRAFLDDPEVTSALADTHRPDEIDESDHEIVFFAGGHGAMWDLPHDERLAALTAAVYERGGVVAAVCHGPAGLVPVRLSDGRPLVEGKQVAAFTDDEERAVGLHDVVPFLLAQELTKAGAHHTSRPDFQAHVVRDGRLVTGQNPASAEGVAVSALAAARERVPSH